MNRIYARSVVVFCLVAIGIGIAILVQTVRHGGGTTGYVVGALFIVLGAARYRLQRRLR